ncbi:hypothetical protein Nepgr_013387 [Nepenthes gracilis]|uniref:Protein-tyrosine-phosphatase MKP1 n=1 Tax=Nepenthes gracilis TaxID=150966 RepID=A0AAD3SJL1_NEPGR|nr:hypothetical protein Nepgr_013387 [Nepenthes gracilis]
MVGKEDAPSSWGQYNASSNSQKKFWRSSSWSSSRSMPIKPDSEEKVGVDLRENSGNSCGQARKFPAPLTPRSQQNSKARSCLPPLQPLAIARRSLDEWPRAGSDDIGEWPGPPTPGGRDVNKGVERLKLDLSSIQRSSDKNGGLVKKDKIAFFDKECSKVAEHIYLGGDSVARNRDILKLNGITHVLNCVGFVCPEYFKADFVYRTLWLQDTPSEDITSILYDVFDYFEDVREQKGRVFVHCCQGVSRSTSLVIAYLMWREGQSFDDAFQYVKEARGIADPNMGFACQLLQCQKRVHAFPLSPSSLFRMYRIAPHSSYDPLHLVPKMLDDPSPSALDSRGAFIIQVPSAIYVWIGKNCGAIMERDARGAVRQIVRYERVEVPVHVIRDEEEPSFFWHAFSDFLIDKSGNGGDHGDSSAKIQLVEKKVDLYDVDFEIFQKAIMGGFVPPFASSEAEHETHLPARESSWSVLRRKFASGHVKEFVLAPKMVINRHHSDSRLNNTRDNLVINPPHTSEIASVPSSTLLRSSSPSAFSSLVLSSSSHSSPHLSPNSISSDSSNSSKYFSDSPIESPLTLSSTVSTLSNSLLSSKTSPNISNNPGYIEVNISLQCPQKTSSPSQRSPLSIAERRGSLSKCLKLPVMADDTRIRDTMKNNSGYHQKDVKMNKNFYFCSESDNGENSADIKDAAVCEGKQYEELSSRIKKFSCSSEESVVDIDDHKASGVCSTPKNNEPSVLSGMIAIGSGHSNHNQPAVYRLPNLDKISMFGACELDTKSAFIFVAPTAVSSLTEERNIYLWIGRSSNLDRRENQGNRADVGDIDFTDWNQIGSDFLLNMALPKDTHIKIVKEGEEPVDFLAMLTILPGRTVKDASR